jgi:hypothetical protein
MASPTPNRRPLPPPRLDDDGHWNVSEPDTAAGAVVGVNAGSVAGSGSCSTGAG